MGTLTKSSFQEELGRDDILVQVLIPISLHA